MSIDFFSIIETLGLIIVAGILLLATIRALQIRGALVSRIFRRRAFWIAAFCVFVMLVILTGGNAPFDTLPLVVTLNNILFALIVPVSLAFVDSTVLAAMELDFFHRDTLRWKQLRVPFYAVALAVLVIFILPSNYTPPALLANFVVLPLVIAGIPLVLGYSVVTLIVAARRTPDRTMKKHVRLLGYALACIGLALVIAVAISFLLSPASIPTTLNDFLVVVGSYLIYRAVMSLSPTSRIEKEIA